MTSEKRTNLLSKIRALLAKAESTSYPAEAKAYQIKAQELMTRYAIEDADLSPADFARKDELITKLTVVVGPYTLAKGAILSAVARANRCRILYPARLNKGYKRVYPGDTDYLANLPTNAGNPYMSIQVEDPGKPKGSGTFHLIGFESDIELVEMMFTSLLIQATNEMLDSELDRLQANIHGKTWRNSFLKGYAQGVKDRLYSATKAASDAAKLAYGPKTGLALIDKERQVEQETQRRAGGKRQVSASVSSAAYGQGKQAANRADVGSRRVGSQKALR